MAVPTHLELLNPTLLAFKRLGDSASKLEIDEDVTKWAGLSEEDIAQPHDERQTELQYRLAWARTYLKAYGLIDNSSRGVWSLTPKGKETEKVDPRQVSIFVRNRGKKKPQNLTEESTDKIAQAVFPELAETLIEQSWREKLSHTLHKMKPDAFERLCQRLLRESGFTQVTVTGRSGDGGIDGFGFVRLGGLLSFPILFQCKRYRGAVSSSMIRDFRGAMVGRADRGLVITTGTFTRDAKLEATRDGAPPIDLLDGEQLLDKLKELRLGVEIKIFEEILIIPDWFEKI